MSDRLTLSRAIEDAGIERAKAERVASAIVDLNHDEVATKSDVKEARAELKADIAALRSKLLVMEYRIVSRLGGLIVVMSGLLFAALRYVPPATHG